ncbi:MAG TPA: enoyl-CoA hydratase-related protein [Myxococcota bacterium]|nr:enoyl-CoA hydratase-related protein [Myxococcota bacterium]
MTASERAATHYAIRGRAAWIRIDQPETRNALTEQLLAELADRLDAAIGEPRARAVVLTGSGSAFCAGADLKRGGAGVTSIASREGAARAAGAAAEPDDNAFVAVLETMQQSPKPVICAVNGHAFGGGIGLVAAADIAIAVRDAKFAFSEVRLGVIPAIISVAVLPKLGAHHALRLFLTGDRFTAADAVGYGLVHRVVEPSELESAVQAEIDLISQGAPQALAEAKRLVREVPRLPAREAYAYAAQASARKFASAEAAEGLAAFAQKRPPSWAAADRED